MKTKLPFDAEIEVRSEGTLRLAGSSEIETYDYEGHCWAADIIRQHIDLRNWFFWAER